MNISIEVFVSQTDLCLQKYIIHGGMSRRMNEIEERVLRYDILRNKLMITCMLIGHTRDKISWCKTIMWYTTLLCICCGSILSLVQFLFFFVLHKKKRKENKK